MRVLFLLPILLLTGCLTTSKPAFTDENSIRASKSTILVSFIDVWEARYGPEDSPRAVVEQDLRVLDLDGMIVVEEPSGAAGAEYYSIGMMGNRPIACFVHDSQIQDVAEMHDVTVTVDREEGSNDPSPAPIRADGSAEALFGFVVDAFRNGTLSCFAPPKGGLK